MFDRVRDPVLPRPAIVVDQKVTGEPGQPGGKGSLGRAETLQRAKYPKEDFLGEILRLPVSAYKPIANAIHSSRVHANQFIPACGVTAQAAFYQTDIRIQAVPDDLSGDHPVGDRLRFQ